MAGVQAIDWFATLFFLAAGVVTLAQVSTASVVPVLYIIAVVLAFPRNSAPRPVGVA